MPEELSRILSGDPLPRVPVEDDPDIDKWRRDVVSYLRRLTGKLTNQIIEDSAGAMVIWEHLDDVTSTVTSTAGNSGWKTLKSVTIPADTIKLGGALTIEAWGHMPLTQVGTNFDLRFTLGGNVLVFTAAGVINTFWFCKGAIRVGVDSWIFVPRQASNAFIYGDTGDGVDITVDQTFTIDVEMPAATLSFSIDKLHLRQAGTRTPP